MTVQTSDRRQFARQDVTIQTIQHELAMAGQIQRSQLQTTSEYLNGYELAGQSISCIELGGDYFDFIHDPDFPDEAVKVVVGDVSGHGIDAALLMSSARAFIRALSTRPGSPAEIISTMNRHFCLDNASTGHFMTLFYLDVDLYTGEAHWVRAGHDPAIVYTPAIDQFLELKGSGLPLGVDSTYRYSAYPLPKYPDGSVIAVGTDGIWNATDEDAMFFGRERFRDILRETATRRADEIVSTVFQELSTFCNNVPLDDDITLVIVKAL